MSNAVQTINDEMIHLIIYCLNCVRRDWNATYDTGLKVRLVSTCHLQTCYHRRTRRGGGQGGQVPPPQFGKKNDLFGQILILFGQLSSVLKFIRGANLLRFDYVWFFFWVVTKKLSSGGKKLFGRKNFSGIFSCALPKIRKPVRLCLLQLVYIPQV